MKALSPLLALLAAAPGQAGPTDTAIIAAMKLSEAQNYTWACTVIDDARTYTIEGKTQHGHTWQRQPMPKTIARRLGREAGSELDAIFSAWDDYVIETAQGWQRLDELPKVHDDWVEQEEWYYMSTPIVRTADMPADESQFDPFGLPPAIYLPVLRAREEEEDTRPYSNAQFALALPHDELAVIVSSHADLQVEGDIATGTLTDLGARLLLVHDGHEYIRPVIATGRFKLWLGAGQVNKFLIELAGIVLVERKPVYVRQRSCTTISDVGRTVVSVPADARRRLEG